MIWPVRRSACREHEPPRLVTAHQLRHDPPSRRAETGIEFIKLNSFPLGIEPQGWLGAQ